VLLSTNLLHAFEKLVDAATQVDIAVAWIGSSKAIKALRDRSRSKNLQVRVLVGLSGNGTDPTALRSLQEFAAVRAAPRQNVGGIFHPKFYLFHLPSKKVCWVGSANFTAHGLAVNHELVKQSSDDDGVAAKWFDELWKVGSKRNVVDYIANWKPSPRPLRALLAVGANLSDTRRIAILRNARSWQDYVGALRQCDEHWTHAGDTSVLGEASSWTATINVGQDLITREQWDFSPLEVNRLLGRDKKGGWDLLGSTRPTAIKAFRRSLHDVRNAIRGLGGAQHAIDTSIEAIRQIQSIDAFGRGVATRLITLARPDLYISVNGASEGGLMELTGLTKTQLALKNPEDYERVLKWLYQQLWYNDQQGAAADPAIWSMRAALVDCFVYRTKH
jgi:hypothetical protein